MTRLGYLKAFATSWQHGMLAIATIGLPIASAVPLAIIGGAVAYVLGWVYLGDSRWFRRKVDAADLARLGREEDTAIARVQAERNALLARLPSDARERYSALAEVCRDIESQLTAAGSELAPAEKIDGLMWNYLSLLGNEATLEDFLLKESDEAFTAKRARLEKELAKLNQEVAATEPGTRDYEMKMQLVASRQEGLEALRRRHEQVERATENVRLVRAEQERIAEQLKLLRADLYASKAVGQISQRVSETIDSLASSGRISAEVPPSVPELPAFRTRRIGYDVKKE
jgi:hypothetical protein